MSNASWSIHPPLPDLVFHWASQHEPITRDEVEQFFMSNALCDLKQRVCDIGHRLWQKGYVDGNGGNISVRVSENLILCTPTLISKGFMMPNDLCLVDLDGRQKAGNRPSTSEIKTHLAIYKNNRQANACVHAHPVHANSFLITGNVPPTGVMPEPDIFFGEVGMADYATPGTVQNAENVGKMAKEHQCIFMACHGVIVWGAHIEDTYWKLENVDAYCQILLLSTQLNQPLYRVNATSMREFIAIRKQLGMPDNRDQRDDANLFNSDAFAGKPFHKL